MKTFQTRRNSIRQKPQRLHVTFPFRVISANKLHEHRNGHNHSTRQYKKFTKKCFRLLEERGFRRGCLDLRGDLILNLEVGLHNRGTYLSNCQQGILGSLVQFFGGWDVCQIREIRVKKYWVDSTKLEYFNVLITKSGKNLRRA